MAEAEVAQTGAPSNRLEALTQKYGHTLSQTPQQRSYQAFDAARSYSQDKQRISSYAGAGQKGISTGDLHSDFASIQLDLAELAEQYGELNVQFKTLVGKSRIFHVGDALRIGYNKVVGDKKKVREIKLEAVKRRGDAIEYLVNTMAKVMGDQYQKAVQGRERSEGLQVENISHLKFLDQKLIKELKGSQYTGSDLTQAEYEVNKFEQELSEIDQVLMQYQTDIQTAKAAADLARMEQLTGEVSQVLDIKHGVLDGRLAADGIVSNIRRDMLDHAEGAQSAKGAIAATKVNYQAINALIDAMSELEIKYKHCMEDMIPVFQMQGKIAGLGHEMLDVKETLLQAAAISQRLMDANAKLVTHLAAETFQLLKTPIYDVDKANAVEEQIRGFMAELNEQKKEWAENQSRLVEIKTGPHYAQPR